MKSILHVISSPRGAASQSIRLSNAIIEKIIEKYPGSTQKTFDLSKDHFPHLEESHLTSFFTPVEQRSEAQQIAIRHSDDAIAQIQEADILVIGAPMYNFGIHSALKAWIDHIVRAGITFRYSESGPEGLIKNKKVYVAVASGSVYSEGPLQSIDHVAPYLRTALGFIGLTDISIFRVEGLAIPGIQESALERGIDSITVD